MRFGKLTMFLLLNGAIAIILILYFGIWMLSGKTTAAIIPPYNANTITVQYEVKGNIYKDKHLRGEIPFFQKQVSIYYFILDPSSSRINSFMGLYAEPLAWWLVFLIASSMLLLMTNTVFTKGTIFQLQKKFPWISMDEYFPAPGNRWYSKQERKSSPPEKKPKRLDNGTSKTLTS
jgi:hypothetical protein